MPGPLSVDQRLKEGLAGHAQCIVHLDSSTNLQFKLDLDDELLFAMRSGVQNQYG